MNAIECGLAGDNGVVEVAPLPPHVFRAQHDCQAAELLWGAASEQFTQRRCRNFPAASSTKMPRLARRKADDEATAHRRSSGRPIPRRSWRNRRLNPVVAASRRLPHRRNRHIAENELVYARLDGRRRQILVVHDNPLESLELCAYGKFTGEHKGEC
jgi:hypothetical protein